jgi:hypothetical protein
MLYKKKLFLKCVKKFFKKFSIYNSYIQNFDSMVIQMYSLLIFEVKNQPF